MVDLLLRTTYNIFKMEELLQKLLEAEVLSEETKTQLLESMTAQIEEATATAKAETEVTVRSELQEQGADHECHVLAQKK